MYSWKIRPSRLQGLVAIPSSKSQTLRALLFASVAAGTSSIESPLLSDDTEAMIAGCRQLGATIEAHPSGYMVHGLGKAPDQIASPIDAHSSGIVLRFLSAMATVASSHPVKIVGSPSLQAQRPVDQLLLGLRQLGARQATSLDQPGRAPLLVQGPLRGGCARIEGSDSQPVSALLIASAFAQGPTELRVDHPGEGPWILLTLDWLSRLAIWYEREGFSCYRLQGNSSIAPFHYRVGGDWSSAAFPAVAALVTDSCLTLTNLEMSEPQGDKKAFEVMKAMGAAIEIESERQQLTIWRDRPLQPVDVNINDCIDALPALAVLACYSQGVTRLRGVAVARNKECDRIAATIEELTKMGAVLSSTDDGNCLNIIGRGSLQSASLNSYHDHRMAMALATAALGAEGETTIQGVDCVAKTFPHFGQTLQALGADLVEATGGPPF